MTTFEQPTRHAAVAVTVADIPVGRFLQLHAHLDVLLAELALIAVPDAPRSAGLDQLVPLLDGLSGPFAAVRQATRAAARRARASGATTFALDAVLPRTAGPLVAVWNRLMDEADAASSHGLLLTPPASPEVVELRRWIGAEVERLLSAS